MNLPKLLFFSTGLKYPKHGEEFTLKSISSGWDGLTATEQRNAGKRFREQIESDFPGQFDSWTTTDNERHYRRR